LAAFGVEGVATRIDQLGTLAAAEVATEVGTQESHPPLDAAVSKRNVARDHATGVEGHAFGVSQTDL